MNTNQLIHPQGRSDAFWGYAAKYRTPRHGKLVKARGVARSDGGSRRMLPSLGAKRALFLACRKRVGTSHSTHNSSLLLQFDISSFVRIVLESVISSQSSKAPKNNGYCRAGWASFVVLNRGIDQPSAVQNAMACPAVQSAPRTQRKG